MVIVCDCKYRSAITAIRGFKQCGEDIVAVTTDSCPKPPAFSSRYIKEKFVFSSDAETYKKQLLELCSKYPRPIIFPVGNFTLSLLSNNKDAFFEHADFCVSAPETLINLNDKKWVKSFAQSYGINVPKIYTDGDNISFPVVVKPYCGEKFSLKAEDRYRIVNNRDELKDALEYFKPFDTSPIIEEYINGDGVGLSFMLNENSEAIAAFSHRRLVEYPVTGGPSACLETFFSQSLITQAKDFIEKTGFSGLCMLEFKEQCGKFYLLEINPRVWGSFPAIGKASSSILSTYLDACQNISYGFDTDYRVGVKIKFLRGLVASVFSYLKKGNIKGAAASIGYLLNPCVKTALFSFKDPFPAIRDFFRR